MNISTYRGEQFQMSGIAERANVPINLTLNTTKVEFYAKVAHGDADAASTVKKDGGSGLYAPLYGGVTVDAAGNYVIQVLTADTVGITATLLLRYVVWLTEPDGTRTMIDSGTWRVRSI